MKIKILALGGSVRANLRNEAFLQQSIQGSEDLPEYLAKIKLHQDSSTRDSDHLSNSEILAGASLMGAKQKGCEVEFFPLLKLFKRHEHAITNINADALGLDLDLMHIDLLEHDQEQLQAFIQKIRVAQGIIFVSPVYFGDKSSVANKFIQLAGTLNLLEGKVVGAASVGTKRNGGQETTNLFFLYEALALGAYIVGNGPKSSQSGGTAWAGDKGAVLKDDFGIETTFGTGVRVSQVSRIRQRFINPAKISGTTKIAIIITMDTPLRLLSKHIQDYLAKRSESEGKVSFRLIELIDSDVERCLACNICPIPQFLKSSSKGKDPYACIIRREGDSMSSLRDELVSTDGILLAGLNIHDMAAVAFRYQAFVERTRFIRRNDFELTNVPMAGFLLSEVGAIMNPIHNLKVMTSFMRQNGIMLKPITSTYHQGQLIDSAEKDFERFVASVVQFRQARSNSEKIQVSYHAVGYSDKTLDNTKALRR